MLELTIPSSEWFDERTNEFIYVPATTLRLEHSLISISKWEGRWKKSFFREVQKPFQEYMDYVKCMSLDKNVNSLVYGSLNASLRKQIDDYMDDNPTATKFMTDSRPIGRSPNYRRAVTSELIYCWMFQNNIPMECEKWHINRLMTLIRVCQVENPEYKGKKMPKADVARSYAALNAQRRAQMHSKG